MLQLLLSDLETGEEAIIFDFKDDAFPVKFYEIGIVPGSKITLYKKLPLKGPVSFTIHGGSNIAVRWSEAQSILVKKL